MPPKISKHYFFFVDEWFLYRSNYHLYPRLDPSVICCHILSKKKWPRVMSDLPSFCFFGREGKEDPLLYLMVYIPLVHILYGTFYKACSPCLLVLALDLACFLICEHSTIDVLLSFNGVNVLNCFKFLLWHPSYPGRKKQPGTSCMRIRQLPQQLRIYLQ